MTDAEPDGQETISGVPLGLSRDYDHLPRTGPTRWIYCQKCLRRHQDVERLTEDGCRVLAIMCKDCREKGRRKWIEAQVLDLPVAVATYKGAS